MAEPPPPAGRGGDAAAGGGSGRAGRALAAAPSLRLPAPRSAEETGRREKGEAAKALRTRAGGAAAGGGGVRGRGGGSQRGQGGAGGSAPPPPDSLPRKSEKVLHRVLCQAPRRHRAAGHPPSPSGSRRERPGTRGTSPACPRAPVNPAAAPPLARTGAAGRRLALGGTGGVYAGGTESPGWWGALLQPLSGGTLREGGTAAVPVPCEHQSIP